MSMEDVKSIPLRGIRPAGYSPMQEGGQSGPSPSGTPGSDQSAGYVSLGAVADIQQINTSYRSRP